LEGERLCKEAFEKIGLQTIIARPFCIYGYGENPEASLVEVTRYLRWQLNGKTIQIVGNEINKTRDFIHVSDVVSALVLIADKAYPFETGDCKMLSVRRPPPGGSFSMEDQWLAARRRVWDVRVGAGRGPLGAIARLIGDRDQAL
jgi:hypothetical protein